MASRQGPGGGGADRCYFIFLPTDVFLSHVFIDPSIPLLSPFCILTHLMQRPRSQYRGGLTSNFVPLPPFSPEKGPVYHITNITIIFLLTIPTSSACLLLLLSPIAC